MSLTIASAPAKIHFIGEYSALFGKPVVLSAISLRTTVSITHASATSVLSSHVPTSHTHNLRATVERIVLQNIDKISVPTYVAKIDSDVPVGANLGSSAAVGVAYVAALGKFLGVDFSLTELNSMAFEVEKYFHLTPSGGDNTVSVYGGAIWYRRENSRNFHGRAVKASRIRDQWVFGLVDSGRPIESTKEMIVRLQSLADHEPFMVEEAVKELEEIAARLLPSVEDAEWDAFRRSIRQAQGCIERLGAVGDSAHHIVRIFNSSGCAAKVMGAGGRMAGSGMILVSAKKACHLNAAASKLGVKWIPIDVACPGVRILQ